MNYKKIYMLIMLINLNQKFLSRVFQKILSILFFINFYNWLLHPLIYENSACVFLKVGTFITYIF